MYITHLCAGPKLQTVNSKECGGNVLAFQVQHKSGKCVFDSTTSKHLQGRSQ